jgi:hypothetical protein
LDGSKQILRGLAYVGDQQAAWWLADLLAERGDLDGAVQLMRGLADAGDEKRYAPKPGADSGRPGPPAWSGCR